jgi:hypothetical protein
VIDGGLPEESRMVQKLTSGDSTTGLRVQQSLYAPFPAADLSEPEQRRKPQQTRVGDRGHGTAHATVCGCGSSEYFSFSMGVCTFSTFMSTLSLILQYQKSVCDTARKAY